MINEVYKKQVALLLNVLPEVNKESCFAMHGGTAINLFIEDMPRLSVDIDLTYALLVDRNTAIQDVGKALERIKHSIERTIPRAHVIHRKEIAKLQISLAGADIKLEVNLVSRGLLGSPILLPLCNKAQDNFNVFCEMPIVPLAQLFGGKICAALDRQHPRDLFDIKRFLARDGYNEDVKQGFLYCLLCSDRPIHEIIEPNLQDQRLAFEHQFAGMSDEPFTYIEYESTRLQLIEKVQKSITESDKEFLLSFANATPDWNVYHFQPYPAITWKLQNIQKLKTSNLSKHKEQLDKLTVFVSKL